MAVRLTREQLNQMWRQAHAEAPNECCGALLGRGEIVELVFPGRNVHETPRTRYNMQDADVLRVNQLEREREWDLVGIYHSHPETKPEPSVTDKFMAAYPDACYVIMSMRDLTHPEVRAWRIADKIGGDGKPVKDAAGRIVKDATEEEVVVT